jgi:hypothetical protein
MYLMADNHGISEDTEPCSNPLKKPNHQYDSLLRKNSEFFHDPEVRERYMGGKLLSLILKSDTENLKSYS